MPRGLFQAKKWQQKGRVPCSVAIDFIQKTSQGRAWLWVGKGSHPFSSRTEKNKKSRKGFSHINHGWRGLCLLVWGSPSCPSCGVSGTGCVQRSGSHRKVTGLRSLWGQQSCTSLQCSAVSLLITDIIATEPSAKWGRGGRDNLLLFLKAGGWN